MYFNTALLVAIVCFCTGNLAGQISDDLRRDEPFFRKKIPEFRKWLAENRLDKFFVADSFSVTKTKATLFLRPAFSGDHVCDSMQCVWNNLEEKNRDLNGQFFHERLLKKWAFLAEIREEQAEIVVRCHQPAHFFVKIYGENGKIPVEGRSLRSAIPMQISLPSGGISGVNVGENSAIVRSQKVGTVCANAKVFFINWYKKKGTPVLWNARIDTTYSFEDEFVVEVTHLSNEICPEGYYEFHRIFVKGTQRGEDVELRWDFQGKYGSGVLFPPRRNNYKDMELKYKNDLTNYQNALFKRMLTYLGRR